MSRIRADELRRHLDRTPPSGAYYVHGSEQVLKDDAVAALLDAALEPSVRDFNLDVFSAQQLDPDALAAACATLPMMADRRVVVLRDVEAWKRKTKAKQPAADYLAKPAPDTVIVIVQGNDDVPDADLARHCTTIDCAPLSGDALDAWLDERLDSAGVTLETDVREYLLRATGADLGTLHSEVAKLAGLGGAAALTRDTVSELVGIRHGETPDDWRDAVLRDDTATALAILPRVLDQSGVTGVKLMSNMGSSLLVLRWARATAEHRKIKGKLLVDPVRRFVLGTQPRPYHVGSFDILARVVAEAVGKWSDPRCRRALVAALAADTALKNTTISGDLEILTDFVLTLATSRQKKAA